MVLSDAGSYDLTYPRLVTKAQQLCYEMASTRILVSNSKKWEAFQEFARVHEKLTHTVKEHEQHPNMPVVDDTTLLTDAATHVNVVTMVAKCIKQYDCSNFEASSKIFDSWSKAVIDVYQLGENLRLSWKNDPLLTRKLIFYMGNMKNQRWVFRFGMKWMYDHHREEFLANVHTIPKLMALQELNEILSFCLNRDDHPLFGIKTAYAKHLLSKSSHACEDDPNLPVRESNHKSKRWKNAQRQSFADSKGYSLTSIYQDHYDKEQKLLMTLIKDVDYLYRVIRQFRHEPTCGQLNRLLCVDPLPFFEKFISSNGSYVALDYLGPFEDYIKYNDDHEDSKSCTHSDDEDTGDCRSSDGSEDSDHNGAYYDSGSYFAVPNDFLRTHRDKISTSDRCIFLHAIKKKLEAGLLHTFSDVSHNLINVSVDQSFNAPKYMQASSYDRAKYFEKFDMQHEYHKPYVHDKVLSEQEELVEYYSHPTRKFDTIDKIHDIISNEDEYTYEWFKYYGGDLIFMTAEDGTQQDDHSILKEQVEWYETACIAFFWPRKKQVAYTAVEDAALYEYEIEDAYRGAPWTQYDVRHLRDIETISNKANAQNRLLYRKGFTDDVKTEFNEYLTETQANISKKTKEVRRTEQQTHEKLHFPGFKKNKFFLEVVELYVSGLLFELDQTERINAGEEGVELHGMWAKWAPSPNKHHDKATGLASAISDRLAVELNWAANPRLANGLYNYAHQVLTPIRKAAKIAESFVGMLDKPQWDKVDYTKLSQWAMKYTWDRLLKKNDPDRFAAYHDDDTTVLKIAKIQPSTVMQSQIDAMAYLGTKIHGDSLHIWQERSYAYGYNKITYVPITFLSKYSSYGRLCTWKRAANGDEIKEEVLMSLKIAAKQWQSMLLEAVQSFHKIKKSHDPRRECVVTILDYVRGGMLDVEGKALAVLLATCSRVAGSPWHSERGSDVVCAYGTSATIQTVSTNPNSVQGAESLFSVDALRIANSIKCSEAFEQPEQATVYQALDLIIKRAVDHHITKEEFATWTLVFISDREFEEPELLQSTWHIPTELPYQKLRRRIDESDSGFGRHAGYPKFVFYRECCDQQEMHSSGIPAGDNVPGVIMLSGDTNSCVGDILEACFAKGVNTTKNALSCLLNRTRFDMVSSRI